MSRPPRLPGKWAALSLGVLALFCTLDLWIKWGANLNLYLASATIAAVIMPAFAAVCPRLPDRLLASAALGIGVGLGWIAARHASLGVIGQSVRCALIVAALGWAGLATADLGRRWRLPSVCASGLSVLAILAWLLWPIWTTTAPPLLVEIHPLLTINGILSSDFGAWTEQPVVYQWGVLGQDAPYQLPQRPWPCLVSLVMVGVVATVAGQLTERWRARPA